MDTLKPEHSYVPVLKAKAGELSALKELSDVAKAAVVPLLEIPNVRWDFFEDKPDETTKDLIGRVVPSIKKNWGANPFYLDIYGNPDLYAAYEGEVDIPQILHEALKDQGLTYTPVISLDYPLKYLRGVVSKLYDADKNGIALRIVVTPETVLEGAECDAFLGELGLEPEKTDLILDLGSVYRDKEEAVYLASRLVLAEMPYIQRWRNVILSASSFPKTVGASLDKNSTKLIERSEWLGWKKLTRFKKLPRKPIYSDYAVSHPEVFDDVDPRHMKISGTIRYTSDTEWLLVKGEKLIGDGAKGFSQFQNLSEEIVKSGKFHGADTSWGDNKIAECAAGVTDSKGKLKTGNLTTWRQIANNQHITYVTQQLAKLDESASKS